MVYRQFMTIADKLYITHIHHTWQDADTFFPTIEPTVWQQTAAERHEADENNPYPYTYAEYLRKTQ
jgi:dihydrofolate reductase